MLVLSLTLANNDAFLLGSTSEGFVNVWLFQDLLLEILSSKEERDILYSSICKFELKEGKVGNLKIINELDSLFFTDDSTLYAYSWSSILDEIKDKISLGQQSVIISKFKNAEKSKYSISQDCSHSDIKIQSIDYDENLGRAYLGSNYGEIVTVSLENLTSVKIFSPVNSNIAIDAKELGITSIKCYEDQSVLFGNNKGNIELWDLANQIKIQTFKIDKESLNPISHLEFEKDKKWFVSVHKDYIIRWHTKSGIVDSAISLESDVYAISLQENMLLTGQSQNSLINWNIQTGDFSSKLEISSQQVTSLFGISNGKSKLIIAGGSSPLIDVFSNNQRVICFTC